MVEGAGDTLSEDPEVYHLMTFVKVLTLVGTDDVWR